MAGSFEFPRGAGVGEAAEPAFRYALPATPVAAANVDIGHVGVQVELFLAGELDVITTARRPPVDAAAFRACTLKALRAMAKGLMVTGLGSYTPTITSGARHVFTQTGHQFRAPNTMAFAGACTISFAQRCECGTVSVAGDVRYSLDVTAMPLNGQLADPPGASGWFVRYEEELASIGMVVLVGVPIPPGQLV
jgi:hypothetical protein